MNASVLALREPWVDSRRLLVYSLLSLSLHLVVILWLAFKPNLFGSKEIFAPVYTVDLVGDLGLPPPPGGPEAAEEVAAEPAAPPAQEETAAPVAKKVSPAKMVAKAPPPAELIPIGKDSKQVKTDLEPLTKQGEPKQSSKVKEIEPEKEIDKALERIEDQLAAKRQAAKKPSQEELAERHLAQALARTRERVASGAYGLGGGGGGSRQGSDRFAQYYSQVWAKIRSNWTLPEEWQQSKMEAIVVVTVRPDGAIAEVKFERRSGHERFDQSVLWAVERANPLPPLPAGLASGSQEIGIRFRPEG